MASFDQKLRTLYLMEILLERTDDAHMLNASELCTILDQEYGISTDRRTIYTEMEILDKFGLDIQQKKGKCPRIIMMINKNRLVHKWQEKSLLHQPFCTFSPRLYRMFSEWILRKR